MNFSIVDVSKADIALRVAAEAAAADCLARELSPQFSLALKQVMMWRECTADELAAGSLLSTRTVTRLRTGKGKEPLIETVSAILIGLQLPDSLIEALIERVGRGYKLTPEHQVIKSLVKSAYGQFTIHDVNAALRKQGIEELTGKE